MALIEIQKRLMKHSATSPVTQEQLTSLLKRVRSQWTDEIISDLAGQLENFKGIKNISDVLIQLQRGILITGLDAGFGEIPTADPASHYGFLPNLYGVTH